MKPPPHPFVVAVSQGPTPYYTPILNELSKLVRLHVVYMGRGSLPRSGHAGWTDFQDIWGEPPAFEYSSYRSLPIAVGRLDFHARLSVGISKQLDRLAPDVVVVHSWGPLMIEPLIWSRRAGRRAVMWTESSARTGLLRDPITMFARRRVVAHADAFLSTGSMAAGFVEDLGADPRRIVRSCLPSPLAESMASMAVASPRGGTGAGTRFLFVGRLVALKRPVELAQAFIRALPALGAATLTFVGDGPLRGRLAEMAAATGGRVRLLERAEGRALAAHYLGADILVIPSVREVWGLVVNEALAAGLYVIATDQVGSAVDLLDDDAGLIIPAGDPDRLIDALRSATTVDQSETGRSARRARIRDCTRRWFAAELHRAIELALGA